MPLSLSLARWLSLCLSWRENAKNLALIEILHQKSNLNLLLVRRQGEQPTPPWNLPPLSVWALSPGLIPLTFRNFPTHRWIKRQGCYHLYRVSISNFIITGTICLDKMMCREVSFAKYLTTNTFPFSGNTACKEFKNAQKMTHFCCDNIPFKVPFVRTSGMYVTGNISAVGKL